LGSVALEEQRIILEQSTLSLHSFHA